MSDTVQNGKGDSPRNCFSQQFRDNYDSIDWSKGKEQKKTPLKYRLFIDSNWSDTPDFETDSKEEMWNYISKHVPFYTTYEVVDPDKRVISEFVSL